MSVRARRRDINNGMLNDAELWKSITAVAFSGAALVAAFAFIARSIFLHFLSHDLEAYKAKLAAENTLAVEKFKAELQSITFQRQQLHVERMKILADLYERLVISHDALLVFVSVREIENYSEAVKNAMTKADEFFNYFDNKRIYFDENLCQLIENLHESFTTSSVASMAFLESGDRRSPDNRKFVSGFMDRIPPLRSEIENRVRAMLGV